MAGWLDRLLGRKPAEQNLGRRGEDLAARFLRGLKYTIITRNYRAPTGEIDIIARDGKMLVFVEVKTRMEDDPSPEVQVSQTKQHQLTKAAKTYLGRYSFPQPPARFDVVAIVGEPGAKPEVRHIKSAFQATF
jgi:putative endonuclease